jgi:hypothetical protein
MEQRKTLFGWPSWSDVQSPWSGAPIRTSRDDVYTAYAETTFAVVQLADVKGIGIEAVRLRLTAWAFRPHHDVTATLEVEGGRSFMTIARLDAWPADPHTLSRSALKLSGRRDLEGRIDGCHVHRFEDNAKLGRSAFGPGANGNLPIAVSFPGGLRSFRHFLRAVGTEFNIDGPEEINPPESWQRLL